MIDAPIALAFSAGMVVALNPCGFAMLPAYLSYFIGLEEEEDAGALKNLVRSLGVGLTLTAGFVAVFGAFGLLISHLAVRVNEYLPFVSILIGIGLLGLGVAMLRGFSPVIGLPKMSKGTGSRQYTSIFLFGVSYAVASLSCTIGPFLAITSTTFSRGSVIDGVATFVIYALGMGMLITVLTVFMGLAKTAMLSWLRRSMQYVNRISGGLLLIAGLYVVYYGWYEVRLFRSGESSFGIIRWIEPKLFGPDPNDNRLVSIGQDFNNDVAQRIDDIGATRVGIGSAIIILLIAGLLYVFRQYGDQILVAVRKLSDPIVAVVKRYTGQIRGAFRR